MPDRIGNFLSLKTLSDLSCGSLLSSPCSNFFFHQQVGGKMEVFCFLFVAILFLKCLSSNVQVPLRKFPLKAGVSRNEQIINPFYALETIIVQ